MDKAHNLIRALRGVPKADTRPHQAWARNFPVTHHLPYLSLSPLPDSNQLLTPKSSHPGGGGRHQLLRDPAGRFRFSAHWSPQVQVPMFLLYTQGSARDQPHPSQAQEECEGHTQEGWHSSSAHPQHTHTERHSFKASRPLRGGDHHMQLPCSAGRPGGEHPWLLAVFADYFNKWSEVRSASSVCSG